jgi:hypothetical protein
MVFGAFISAGLWGMPFLRAIGRQLVRPFRRFLPEPKLQPLEALEETREPALEQ